MYVHVSDNVNTLVTKSTTAYSVRSWHTFQTQEMSAISLGWEQQPRLKISHLSTIFNFPLNAISYHRQKMQECEILWGLIFIYFFSGEVQSIQYKWIYSNVFINVCLQLSVTILHLHVG